MSTVLRPAPQLIERDQQLARLDAVLHGLRAGGGGCVVVEGAPGAGKSALLAVAAARCDAAGIRRLGAVGRDLEREFGFGVARQLLEPLLAEPRHARFDGAAAITADLLAGRDVALDPRAGRFGLVHGLYWLVANLAAEGPLALIVDDAQWADAASLHLLAHIAPRIADVTVALIVATRPDARDASLRDLRRDLPRGEHGGTLVLPPLSAPASAALVRSLVPDASPELCESCHASTGGNPFLLLEVARSIRDARAEGVDISDPAAVTTPDAVRDWLRAQIARLDPTAAGVAGALAVLGGGAPPRAVATLADITVHELEAAERALVEAGVLADERPPRFTHPLLQAAAYDVLSPARRAALHRRAAQLLLDEAGERDRIAAHLLRSEADADPVVVAALADAADAALRAGAPEAAAAYLERALTEPPAIDARGDVLRASATALAALGDLDGAVARMTAALDVATDQHERTASVLALASMTAHAAGDLDAAAELLVTSLPSAGLGATEQALAAVALTNLARADGRLRRTARPARAVVDAASRGTDPHPATLTCAGVEALITCRLPDSARRAAQLATRALLAMPVATWSSVADWSPCLAIRTLVMAEQHDVAAEFLEHGLRGVRARNSRVDIAALLAFRAELRLRLGELADAHADAEESIALADAGGFRMTTVLARPVLTEILITRGALDDAERELARVGDGDPFGRYVDMSRLLLAAARDDHHAAVAHAIDTGRECIAAGDVNPSVVPWRSAGARARLASGDAEGAARWADAEVRLTRSFGTPRALGVALAAAGVVHDDEARLREACAVLEPTPSRLALAGALVDLGAHLRAHGRADEALEPLRRALDLAHRAGATPLADRAHADLRAAGARPRRRALNGVEALTPTERRIAQLAARGDSNRQIAQSQFVTPSTVEFHLANAYKKLGVAGRGGLAAALVDG